MNTEQRTIPEEISKLVENLKTAKAFERDKRLAFLEKLEEIGRKTSPLFVLDALIERAKEDPDPYVKRQAWEASKRIWHTVWNGGEVGAAREDEQDRLTVFSKFLVALKEEDDRDDWEVRRAAADWLRENAAALHQNKMAIDALRALLERADKEGDPNVLRSAVEASKALWQEGWNAGHQQAYLYQILKALESENWQIRQAAADWLGEKAADIAEDNLYLADALSALLATAQDAEDHVRRSAVESSKKIWNAAWEDPEQRAAVLRRALEALRQDEDGAATEAWEIRQAAAEWLGEKASDIAGDNLYVADALNALTRRAGDSAEVFYSAMAARAKIWDQGWALPDQRATILRRVLQALKHNTREGTPNGWEIRLAAAEWLREHGKQLAEERGPLGEALSALNERAGDEQEAVRMAAMQAIMALWPTGQAAGDRERGRGAAFSTLWPGREPVDPVAIEPVDVGNQARLARFLSGAKGRLEGHLALELLDRTVWPVYRVAVVDPVLNSLANSTAWEVREAVADWLGQKAGEIAQESYDDYTKIARALNAARQRDDRAEVRSSAWTSLNALWDALHREQLPRLKEQIRCEADPEAAAQEDDDAKIRAIRQLANPIALGSRQAMAFLVEEWLDWITTGRQPRLVELTAEAMRINRYAILPLVDQFVKVTAQDDQQRRPGGPLKAVLSLNRQDKTQGEAQARAEADRRLAARRRIARQMADMSDPRFFEEDAEARQSNIYQLRRHAIPVLVRRMPVEEDLETLENMARTLGYMQDQEAIDALAQAVAGEEREHNARKKLLAEYYLDPSKQRSEQAAEILREAVSESRRTLGILRWLNIAVFGVGLAVLLFGLVTVLVSEDGAGVAAGGLAAVGGLGGVMVQLVRDPLNRIQNAMSNLVQMETAFTSFIWELNLNGTFIQSRYIAEGKLEDAEIDQTVGRIENAMELTMDLVSTYAELGGQRLVTRIHKIEPVEGRAGSKVTVHGQHLHGDGREKKERSGLVAVNHVPLRAGSNGLAWDEDKIEFHIPPEVEHDAVWISLIVDGIETNALPFRVLDEAGGRMEVDDER